MHVAHSMRALSIRFERSCFHTSHTHNAMFTGVGGDVVRGWTEHKVRVPQQRNTHDCGVLVCKHADFFSDGWEVMVQPRMAPYFRKRMVVELLNGRADIDWATPLDDA